jgi:uncharacterized protein
MQRRHFEYKDTIVTLTAEPVFFEAGERSLRDSRDRLEAYLLADPVFRETHRPHVPLAGADPLAAAMARAAAKAGVGPMAAVAGAFADECLSAMIAAGADGAIVDNGGDIALKTRQTVRVGIYAGPSPIRGIAFEVEPRTGACGICTSSGTVGPSFSYGIADAAVVIAGDAATADAAATALGNRVHSESDLQGCFDFLADIEGVEGGLVILGGRMALWGDLPRLVRGEVDLDRITKGIGN